jgi:2'-5' RNA ligase
MSVQDERWIITFTGKHFLDKITLYFTKYSIRSSSAAEQVTVNHLVVGSNPTSGANEKAAERLLFRIVWYSNGMRFTSCFIGIPLPETYLAEFEQLLRQLAAFLPDARTIRPETPHITLYYLNEQSQDNVKSIAEIMIQHADILKKSHIRVSGFGVFNPESVRVLYAKVEHDDSLIQVNQLFRHALKEFYTEDNNLGFHAHLTLARLPNDDAREQFKSQQSTINQMLSAINWSFPVTELVLYGVDSTQEVEHHQKLGIVKV